MKRLRSTQGFTLIELVVIILVLGILAVTAIPRFVDLRDEARAASCQGVLGAVRGGIAVIYASNILNDVIPIYPALLDGAADGPNSGGITFFDNVLDNGVGDDNWTKDTTGTIDYTCDPTGGNITYTYTPATGAFN